MRAWRATGTIGTVVDNAATAPTEPGITDPPQPPKKKRAVMRTPGSTIIVIFLLAVGMTPFAWTAPGMLVLYLIPVVWLYWVLRVRTTVTPDGIFVRKLFTRAHLTWPELRGFATDKRGALTAVSTEDTRIRLPAVRGRHLPVLSLLSGGRLPDPTGLTTDSAAESADASAADSTAEETPGSPEQDQDHDTGGGSQHET